MDGQFSKTKELLLQDFDISDKTGFLLEDALESLPPEYSIWHELARDVSDSVAKQTFRQKVLDMPLLDHKQLLTHREKRLAHLQLAVITSGYVWQGGDTDPAKSLPACLAVPFWEISREICLQPIVSYYNLFLANWQIVDKSKSITLENMRSMYIIHLGAALEWIARICYRIELDFVPAIKAIVSSVHSLEVGDHTGVRSALTTIRDVLYTMKDTFTRVHESADADNFFSSLIYATGWGTPDTPLPDGLLFEGVGDGKQFSKCNSFTAAMAPSIHVLDAFLSISHKADSRIDEFLEAMRQNMLPGHRQFIEKIRELTNTFQLVSESEDSELMQAYEECCDAFVKFRNYHIQAVTKYVIVPASKEKTADKEAKSQPAHDTEVSFAEDPMPLLKGTRNDTADKHCRV